MSIIKDIVDKVEAGSLTTNDVLKYINQLKTNKRDVIKQFMFELDFRIDPDFDFTDVPEINVSPPEESQFPAGIAADAISDEQMKKDYLKLIEKNKSKSDYYFVQYQLHKLKFDLDDLKS